MRRHVPEAVALVGHHVADHLRPVLQSQQSFAHLGRLEESGKLCERNCEDVADLGQVHSVVEQFAGLENNRERLGAFSCPSLGHYCKQLGQNQAKFSGGITLLKLKAAENVTGLWRF